MHRESQRFVKMDLREDIKKATSLPLVDNNTEFFPLQGLSQAAKDRKMNERDVKIPRNIQLLEDPDNSVNNFISDKVKSTFDKYEVSADIKEVYGGLNLSNKCWEEGYFKRLEDITNSEEKKSQESICNDVKSYTGNQTDIKNLKDELINRKHKIFRNAAIIGLVKNKKILLEDLLDPSGASSTRKEKSESLKTLHGATSNSTTADDNQIELVPHREDPDIYVHPLMGIDIKKLKNIDFTIPHVGKKTKETPVQYFLRTANDESFEFLKKEKVHHN